MIFETIGRSLVLVLLMAMTFQADAVVGASGAAPQDGVSEQTARGNVTLELLTQTEGADLNNYLHNVYAATKKRWFANLPPSVARGNKGVDVVEFRALQDGTVPKEFVKMKAASGKADLDEAAMSAIRGAAPFGKLPADFTAPYIELRFTFYYNLEPPR